MAACDAHLPLAMDRVTTPANGDTHLLVRRLEREGSGPSCEYGPPAHPAWWQLTPQGVVA